MMDAPELHLAGRVLDLGEIFFPILTGTAAFARVQFDATQLHAPNLAGDGLRQFGEFEAANALEGAKARAGEFKNFAADTRPRLLCVYESTDMCTFLREAECSAGYNALTTLNMDDARILLKATKAKLAVISARMQSVRRKPTRAALDEIDPTVSLLILERKLRHLGFRRSRRATPQQRGHRLAASS
jgi:hypothetical protein